MTKFYLGFIILSLLWLTSACSTTSKIESMKPEPDDAAPLVYEKVDSYLNMPISIKLKDIENKTNATLNGLIFDDSNLEDDDIELKVWKQAPIQISNENGRIKTVLPLKIIAKYRYGVNKMGVDLRDTKEFNLNGVITLLSETHLVNWKLNTKTEFKSLDWKESPTVMVFGKNMPITYLINPALKLFKSKIEQKIDESIEKSMDFKPNVMEALDKIATPFEMSAAYQSWLRIVPTELYATDAKIQKDQLNLQMGLKCNMETLIGNMPEKRFYKDKTVLKSVSDIPNAIAANIVAVSTYSDATNIIKKNFAGQEFGSGSKKVTVQNVALWHKQGKIVIALDLLGSVNGTVYLTGFPQYNDQTKEIFFDQMDYALDTKSSLLRTANWLAQGVILKKIQQMCRYSIAPNLDEAKKSMKQYLTNYSPMPGVFVNGKIDDITFQKIQLTNKAIVAFVKVNGNVNVAVDGLK
ncbi:hypothetical protein B0A58_11960 [Flavobacterium branchiophilum NBRC 15030 = ATCC 35035]|uniref:DUF4403 domain-containing protein n=2 Tax=Flavobacterium branchiophilum TaxID=55197 RepID=A0A2H3KD82_9FLAO|nr:DUF4403 family protein [Flavobacterium branchiophilum]OXA73158.1 hypothetical protein B0A58_11960 [Flavobacterium branchiophilum NBRC 15030 = ATCC 35035]PDS25552.1 DUF4403 domain-containing protein [Flavobacterium branchiophilum]TQM40947.1 uncharacterized protein DUF4403 [Flavobacterium branchiophilum]CCB68578.1 Probable lipoprotein precursor [Flavobacterium branchiophilum FL-15]GEM54760.1 hypothetical protein FB1_09810 [Flavobacterium branchiophilum NBRC 15030 = ATCC 35035]